MKLSEHFNSEEFTCQCGCGLYLPNSQLIDILEDVRLFFGAPVKINSGTRCKKHNLAVGGEVNSQHMLGTAADIVVANTLPEKVYTYLDGKYPGTFGIGLYSSWTHIDTRKVKARWHR